MGSIKRISFTIVVLLLGLNSRADDATKSDSEFYQQLKKTKNPTREQIKNLRSQTLEEDRTKRMNQLGSSLKKEDQENHEKLAAEQEIHPDLDKDTARNKPDRGKDDEDSSSSSSEDEKKKSESKSDSKKSPKISVPTASGNAPAKLNLKEEDYPKEMHFPEETPTPRKSR